MCITDRAQITKEILAYLVGHPDAQDTLEGVVEWWLLEEKINTRMATVKDALAELVAKELVLASTKKGAGTLYRINKRKSEEISKVLTQSPDG